MTEAVNARRSYGRWIWIQVMKEREREREREKDREREEGHVIDGKLNGRMNGGLTFGYPLNSNLFYRPILPGGPVNFNIRTDAIALTIRQDLRV